MNFEFAEKINPLLKQLDFTKAIEIAEMELNQTPSSKFHFILGNSLDMLGRKLCEWIDVFYLTATRKHLVQALYLEMNEFDINTDQWYIDAFAYKEDGGNINHEWLCYFESDSQELLKNIFLITGYEPLQEAFEEIDHLEENGEWTDEMQIARDWCEQLIIAQFMKLVTTAQSIAESKGCKWAKLPIYFTEHEYDFIIRSPLN